MASTMAPLLLVDATLSAAACCRRHGARTSGRRQSRSGACP